MPSAGYSSVYLTGWEFNRLLSEDPIAPRLSCLPAAVLWHGSALFWMFETVYCTAESLDGEHHSAQGLGWPSGRIFIDLANLGVLERVDWQHDLSPETKYLIRERHQLLRERIPEPILRSWIINGEDKLLEETKLFLLEPALENLGCFLTAAPNSIPSWFDSDRYVDPKQTLGGYERQRLMTASRTLDLGGLSLVPHPADATTEAEMRVQDDVVRRIESPLIPDLLLGTGPNEGLDGHLAHVEALLPHTHAFKPFNLAMASAWETSRADLMHLRRLARRYLWPRLHGELLPELERKGQAYARQFESELQRAVLQSPIAGMLNMDTSLMFSFVAAASALTAGAALAADYHPIEFTAGSIAATLGAFGLAEVLGRSQANIGGLRTFVQQIRR